VKQSDSSRSHLIQDQEVNQHRLSVEIVAIQLVTNFTSLKQTEAVNLLQSWIDDEDESEQQETGQYLIHALDEDRLSDRNGLSRVGIQYSTSHLQCE
jgi:hypothetical protein